MNILVINCGSSSLKYSLWDGVSTSSTNQAPITASPLLSGRHEKLSSTLSADKSTSGLLSDSSLSDDSIRTQAQALAAVLSELADKSIHAVGYRVVHGGDRFTEATIIDTDVLNEIKARIPDAPMHNPFALAAIQTLQKELPDALHVAVFDTGFHASMPNRAKRYAIAADVAEKYGIQRFGFHGISHAYVADRAAQFLNADTADLRLITLHLGNGASACAVEYGRSTETSMGNTPLEGLVMGTRSGDVDAGVLMSLLRSGDFDVNKLDELLNSRSGLLGLSGISNDVREIENAAQQGDPNARLAINVFAHRVRKYIGAYAASMGGVDAIVFTGGIGENSVTMRNRVLQRLEFMGIHLDDDLNRDLELTTDNDVVAITAATSRVKVLAVKTNESRMIARQTAALLVAREKSAATKPGAAKPTIPIAVSGRHAHLTQDVFATLFGKSATPTRYRDLSQPGQYACEEKINLIGPRNRIDGVRILGPLRSINQIEISRTDEFTLGIDAPVRDSGKVAGSAPITIEGPQGSVHLSEGLICARRHIHMQPKDAEEFGVEDRQEVAVAITGGPRDLIFGDVLIRVSEKYKLEMHIDTDEGNAAELSKGAEGDLGYCDVDDACASINPTPTGAKS